MSSQNISRKGTYAIIPARGGSKGLPGKNIKKFCGKPLIAWTIEAAFQCPSIERVIVSSDDEEIISVSREYGAEVPFKREPRLSGDAASTVDVVIDALKLCPEAETVVLLQPTSPLRTSVDIKNALDAYFDASANSSVSVSEATQSPYLMFSISDQQTLVSLLKRSERLRRQDLPTAYILNGAIYIADVEWLKRTQTFLDMHTLPYVMPFSRSVDIDTLDDFKYAEYLMSENNKLDGL